MDITNYLIKNEGEKKKGDRHIVYQCTAKKWTLGYGRNVQDRGISESEARYLLENDINECMSDLETIFPNWFDLPYNRKMVLVDMRFQLGATGFRGFKRLIEAIRTGDIAKAIQSIKESLYYKQVKNRADENINLLREG
jgi:lysozyme